MTDNKKIAGNVLQAIGGKDNVTQVTHCMTRLRFNLKDQGLPNDEEVKAIAGVLGVARSASQYQVIIGPNVAEVYNEVCKIGNFVVKSAINENLDTPKEKLTLGKIGSNILDYVSGSMVQIIPIIMLSSFFGVLKVILGPSVLNVISEGSDLYVCFNFLYEAGFYSMPIYLGYAAAKRLGLETIIGIFTGALLITPSLLNVVTAGNPFTVYGIPMTLVNYSQSVFPVLLSVAFVAVVYKFVDKHLPKMLAITFTPFVSFLISVPFILCFLAPLGSILGNYVNILLSWVASTFGFVGVGIIAAIWQFLVLTGMHIAVGMPALMTLLTIGSESVIMPSGAVSYFAVLGMGIGALLRIRNSQERALALGNVIGGLNVTEPILFGIGMKYKRPFIGMVAGGLVGGLCLGLFNCAMYSPAPMPLLAYTLGFAGGGTNNVLYAIIAAVLALVVSAVVTYLFGFRSDDPALRRDR